MVFLFLEENMITKQELKERATLRKAEIEIKGKGQKAREEMQIQELVEQLVDKCYTAMEKAANEGKFYTEIEINTNCNSKVNSLLFARLSEFSPQWVGDGYRNFLRLSWNG
jgi:hypothetical protein